MLTASDLTSDGFGQAWGHTRSYSNRLSANPSNEGVNGASWFIKECPRLVNLNPTPGHPNQATIVVIGVISEAIWFDHVEATGAYQPRFFVPATLAWNNGEFLYADRRGRRFKFYDFKTTPVARQGQFKSFTNPFGQEMVAQYGANNQISSFTQVAESSSSSSGSSSGSASSLEYQYSYYASGEDAGRLQYVIQRQGGVPVRRTHNTYYGPGGNFGSAGDLQSVTLQQYNGSGWDQLGTTYHRYYQAGDAGGFVHGLKYLVSPATYAMMVATGRPPETVSDGVLAMYADYYFEYDSQQRVSLVAVSGMYSLYSYDYVQSTNPDDHNNWKTRTVETLPDGNQNIVYTNFAGQVMFKIVRSGASEWYDYYQFDGQGRTILHALSSAVASYSESSPGLVILKPSGGLVRGYDYYTSGGSGAVSGYLKNEKVKKGANGGTIRLRAWQYTTQKAGRDRLSVLSQETLYQSGSGGGSSPAVTRYAYEWYAGTLQMQQRTTTPPAIPLGQNGDGNTYSWDEVFDVYGQLVWQRNEVGFLRRTRYDDSTGAVTQGIQDVDTTRVHDPPPGWSTPPGGGLHLITDYTVDNQGRVTQSLGPAHEVDLGGTSTTIRRAVWIAYQDGANQRWNGSGYWKQTDGSYTLINPVQITKSDGLGRVTAEISAVRSTTSGPLRPTDVFAQSSWVRWKQNGYGIGGILLNAKEYFLIPASGPGTRGTNYNETDYGYDVMRRQVRMRTAGGIIMRYVLSAQGEVLQTWVGTDDFGAVNSQPGGHGSGNNMRQVSANEYDGGQPKGDRNLTRVTLYVNASTSRMTTYGYDFRNRRTSTDGEIDFYEVRVYDNQDRVIRVDRHKKTASGKLIARSATRYDNLRRVYQAVVYGVDPNSGTVGNALVSNTWYDPVGNTIKEQRAGSNAFTKSFYDGVRRLTMQYVAYAISSPVAGDIVIQQTETAYDDASNLIEQLVRERFHDAPATAVGELSNPTGTDPKARVSYQAFWPDPLGRQVAAAGYGTYGGTDFSRPDTIPAGSDIVLLTTTHYASSGDADLVTDPAGTVAKSVFDNAGRLTVRVEDYSASPGHLNRETDYAYNADGKLVRLTGKNTTTGDQVTIYTYGTSLSGSDLASNDLLAAVAYPDSTGPADRVTFQYNRQGQAKLRTDQSGTTHTLEYDLLGRQTHDRVTTLGSGVDGAVRRISTTYEVRGMVQNLTSYDNATAGSGTVVNDVQHAYNSFAQLVAQYQSHAGPVNTASSPSAQYGYADGSANTVRPTSITYPNGRVITYDYGTAGHMNDQLSRIASLIDSASTMHLADYTYVGLNRIVEVSSVEPGTKLTYIKQGSEPIGDGGDQYTGWDRFSRVIDQRWINGSGTDLERVQYGFDRASNQLYRANMVASGGQDEYYTYDTLYQLLTLQRGTLNSARTGLDGIPVKEEDFTFDPTGNWDQYVTKASGLTMLNQGRTHNQANEITAINGSSAYIAEDAAGNTVRAPRPDNWLASFNLVYDAWNRLVGVSANPSSSSSSHASGGASSLGGAGRARADGASPTQAASYQYDGLNRRVLKNTTVARHYFYSQWWQIVEERTEASTSADRQFVWGVMGLDNLIERDRGSERFYAVHDVFNCTTITNTSGVVLERYGYTAYGQPRFMDNGFNNRVSSNFDWETLFGDYRWDNETGFYQVRYRYLHPNLGRWLIRDLVRDFTVQNLYLYLGNVPSLQIDPLGLCKFCSVKFYKSGSLTSLDAPYSPNAPFSGRAEWSRQQINSDGFVIASHTTFSTPFDSAGLRIQGNAQNATPPIPADAFKTGRFLFFAVFEICESDGPCGIHMDEIIDVTRGGVPDPEQQQSGYAVEGEQYVKVASVREDKSCPQNYKKALIFVDAPGTTAYLKTVPIAVPLTLGPVYYKLFQTLTLTDSSNNPVSGVGHIIDFNIQ